MLHIYINYLYFEFLIAGLPKFKGLVATETQFVSIPKFYYTHIEKTWLFHPCCKVVKTLFVGVVTTLSPAGMRLETPLDLTL